MYLDEDKEKIVGAMAGIKYSGLIDNSQYDLYRDYIILCWGHTQGYAEINSDYAEKIEIIYKKIKEDIWKTS